MSWALLAWGALAIVHVANNRRPIGRMPLLLWSWPAAWLTSELALHLVVLGCAGTAVLIALGALGDWPGWVGLALVLAAVAWTVPLILRVRATVVDLEDQFETLDPSDNRVEYPRSHVALPFLAYTRRDIVLERGVVYATEGRLRLRLDVFRSGAAYQGALRPAVIHVHGGGWVMGSRHEQGVPLLGHLAANGWIGFNVDYRLSPRATWPAQIVDVKRAIAWVRDHAEELGVDPQMIALTGGSAGGHLTALAALTDGDPEFQPGFEEADTSVAAAVPFYGVYDMIDDAGLHLPLLHRVLEREIFKVRRVEDPDAFRRASPITHIHRDAPPFLVIHGESDSLIAVEEARRFVAQLRETSAAPVDYIELAGAQHAFDVLPSWRTIPVVEAIERFLAMVRTAEGQSHRARARVG